MGHWLSRRTLKENTLAPCPLPTLSGEMIFSQQRIKAGCWKGIETWKMTWVHHPLFTKPMFNSVSIPCQRWTISGPLISNGQWFIICPKNEPCWLSDWLERYWFASLWIGWKSVTLGLTSEAAMLSKILGLSDWHELRIEYQLLYYKLQYNMLYF